MRVTELWLEGKASVEDCRRAADTHYADTHYADTHYAAAAYDAARTVTYAAYATCAVAYDAAYAAYTAVYAADAGARKQKMMEYLYELVYINEIAEQVLLKGQQ